MAQDSEFPPGANSNRSKAARVRPGGSVPADKELPDVKVEQIVKTEDVIVHKASIGKRFKNLFVQADLRGAMRYVLYEVVAPAARSMALEAGSRGIERIIYPDMNPPGHRIYGGPHASRVSKVSYAPPAGYRPESTRPPAGGTYPNRARNGQLIDEYVLVHRSDANKVLERMGDLVETYGIVSVADLHELLGRPITHTMNNYGWDTMRGVQVVPHPGGWMLALQPPGELR